MKVVINTDFGGFAISRKAAAFMAIRGNKRAEAEIAESDKTGEWYGFGYVDGFPGGYSRTDPDLVLAVEKLGKEANYRSVLKVVRVPDDVKWHIEEYDGKEWIAEEHRVWE